MRKISKKDLVKNTDQTPEENITIILGIIDVINIYINLGGIYEIRKNAYAF